MSRQRLVHDIGAVTFFVGVLAAGCSSAPANPVEALLENLQEAAEEQDADAFGELLSEGFEGPGRLPRSEALATLRRYFAAYESVALEVYGVEVETGEGQADVRCVVEFSGEARKLGGLQGLLPPSAVYRFQLGLADEDGEWRVRRAAWERVQSSTAP